MADPEVLQDQVTVQERGVGGGASHFVFQLGQANQLISPWWSTHRDHQLRSFWKTVDNLAGAVYTLESRLKTVPFTVKPKNIAIKSHLRLAEQYQRILEEESDFFAGWGIFYSQFVEDLVTQDNGTFAEILGDGPPDGPIRGMPFGLAHLDSARCQRTSNPEYPIIYNASDGKRSKLHWTRVMFTSQMPSPAETMHRVGFCAVSRCLNVSQTLLDILIYKQEKLGSRPQRAVWVTQGGLDPDDVKGAFILAGEAMDNRALRRYANTVVVGSDTIPEAGIQELDLASLPDGFDEQDSFQLGMATIALAFGVDARELFPGLQSGATRAEALIAHIKQRGKGPGDILKETERLINSKFLPEALFFEFDFQDDEQDRTVAEIKKVRADALVALGTQGLIDQRAIREQMLDTGDLTRDQFERMELNSGRLPDGTDLLNAFHDPEMEEFLDLGFENVLDTEANSAADVLMAIEVRRKELVPQMARAVPGRKRELIKALAALDKLQMLYGGQSAQMLMETPQERLQRPPASSSDEPSEEDTGAPPAFGGDDMELKSNGKGNILSRYLERRDQSKAIQAAAGAVEAAIAFASNGKPTEEEQDGSEQGKA